MKSFTKFFMVVGLLGLMMSCDSRTKEQIYRDYQEKLEKQKWDSIQESRFHGFRVIVIDSCEYLIKRTYETSGHRGYGFGLMSHKGNCKFCEERRKQEKTANHESE